MKQKNNHARSKQKRKALRLKNFWAKVFGKRAAKMAERHNVPGKPLVGVRAKEVATKVNAITMRKLFDNRHESGMNQIRQRLKLL